MGPTMLANEVDVEVVAGVDATRRGPEGTRGRCGATQAERALQRPPGTVMLAWAPRGEGERAEAGVVGRPRTRTRVVVVVVVVVASEGVEAGATRQRPALGPIEADSIRPIVADVI